MHSETIDQPLVSVIVRTIGRKELNEALDSIAQQTYPHIEVIVVHAKGNDDLGLEESCGRFTLRIVSKDHSLPRSEAANLGLDSAQGKYLIFLDEDDLFYPEHVSNLMEALDYEDNAKVAYSGVRVVHILQDSTEGPTVDLNEAFELKRLQIENFIPINAVLFERSLLDFGCHFDNTLELYEDWDFWLQLAQYTTFLHVGKVSACYRNRGSSGFGADADTNFVLQARGRFFEKWKTRWSGEQLSELIDFIKENWPTVVSAKNNLAQARAVLSEQRHQLDSLNERLEEKEKLIHTQSKQIAEGNLQLIEKNQLIEKKEGVVKAYQQKIDEIYQSTSWRITRPIRGMKWLLLRTSFLTRSCLWSIEEHGGGIKGSCRLLRRSWELLRKYGVRGCVNRGKVYLHSFQSKGMPTVQIDDTSATFPLVNNLVAPHTRDVDIIICVHNALDDVKQCLSSLIRYTFPPYRIILVDDGSDEHSRRYLEEFATGQCIQLIRNEQAKGYTLAANQGLRASRGDYVVLLNSDTIVTPQWLDRMVTCAESDPRIAIVGPLSNTASWQSIPYVRSNDDWAANDLPKDLTINEMANLVAAWSGRLYPRIAFLNGFCLLLKRDAIEEIGYFDEDTFGQGYGEENDYCLRVRKAGRTLAVADDVYIYHTQSKSYSNAQRNKLVERSDRTLVEKHGQAIITQGVDQCRYSPVIQGIRARVAHLWNRYDIIVKTRDRWEGRRVLFLLPVIDAGGGGNIVINEACAMIRMGVDARILNLSLQRQRFERNYPNLAVPVIYASSGRDVPQHCEGFDAVIATISFTVDWISTLASPGKETALPTFGYYIQDFEPYFYKEGTIERQSAFKSYTKIPGIKRFCKTKWNCLEVREQTGVDCELVGLSLNVDLFRPRLRRYPPWPQRPLRIVAMIRPATPRRAARLTMEVLAAIYTKYGNNIEIILFGVDDDDPDFLNLPRGFVWKNIGKQPPEELALLFNESEIFVDFSSFQAMGLTAMEAAACGAAVIVPSRGGTTDFAFHEQNAMIVDTGQKDNCISALDRLINDAHLRERLGRQAIFDMAQYYPEIPASRILEILFKANTQ